jgi:transposase InsO family protein
MGVSIIIVVVSWIWQWLCSLYRVISRIAVLRSQPGFFRRKTNTAITIRPGVVKPMRRRPKPAWVKQEVIRLKAHMTYDGCRKIADTFNRLHAVKDRMTVGKTYVCATIRKHHYEIRILRKKIKHQKPRPMPKNLIWSLDLTQVQDTKKRLHTLFGIVDAGTRACLSLRGIPTKASIMLLRILLDAIEQYGKPEIVRTDNEAVFVSRRFRVGLWLLNIKHQRTEVCCPWQNGRIERFFGTLKAKLKRRLIEHARQLGDDLALFRFWYNHVRPHQNLDGKTPAEIWNKTEPNWKGKSIYFEAWDGALTGFYIPPS